MNFAIIGPITKDIINIHNNNLTKMGGIPYYISKAFSALGIKHTAFLIHGEDDKDWVRNHFKNTTYHSITIPNTIISNLTYDIHDINKRIHTIIRSEFTINKTRIPTEVKHHDGIIFGPLFFDDLDVSIFDTYTHQKLIYGNFGLFSYARDGGVLKMHPERALPILKKMDYIFLDEDEICFVTNQKTIKDAVSILETHVEKIIVTKGSRGSEIYIQGEKISIPAYTPERIIDPTGAGDTYLAAFLVAETLFDSYKEIGRFAAMAATSLIENEGTLKLTKEEIIQKIKIYPSKI